jgi:putative restriction endonuclease
VTGNPVRELLVASHILPWGRFPAERVNPRNGLCLAAHFDRAFDRGLISFDEGLRLVVGRVLRNHSAHPAIRTEFLAREGLRLAAPQRFAPQPHFLEYHRVHLFDTDDAASVEQEGIVP